MPLLIARCYPIIMGYVIFILLYLSVFTIGYQGENIEGEDLSFDIDSLRPQIRHYGKLRAGSVMAKSIKFEVTNANGDKDIQRRLVAYDLDAIFPPYDNVYEELVVKARMLPEDGYDIINDNVSIGEESVTDERLGDDENTQQSDLIDDISPNVDKVKEVDAHYHETHSNVEEYESHDSNAVESTIEEMNSEDNIIKENVAIDDHVGLAIHSKEFEMQPADNIDDVMSQNSELRNMISNTEFDNEVETERLVASPGEDIETASEYTNEEANASDVLDGDDSTVSQQAHDDKHMINENEAGKPFPTDNNDEIEEQGIIEDDSFVLPSADDASSLDAADGGKSTGAGTNNSVDDILVTNSPSLGVGQVFEDPDNVMQGVDLAANEKVHHDEFGQVFEDPDKLMQGIDLSAYERVHPDEFAHNSIDENEFVETSDTSLSAKLTSDNDFDGTDSQNILKEPEISMIATLESKVELDEDEPAFAVSSSSTNGTSTVGNELEAHEHSESSNEDVSKETSIEELRAQEETFSTKVERENHSSDTRDHELAAANVVNEKDIKGDTDIDFIALAGKNDGITGNSIIDIHDIIGIQEEKVNTDTFNGDIAEEAHVSFRIETSEVQQHVHNIVGLNGINANEATNIQQEYDDVVEIEFNLTSQSINSEQGQIGDEDTDTDPFKMTDTMGTQSITDDSISHQTNHKDEDNETPIDSSSPKLTANDEFVRGLDDLHKFLEEVDPPDELDVGASGLSIQEVLLGQGVTIIRTRVQKSLDHLQRSFRTLKSKGTHQWNKVKDIIDDNFDINVEEAALSAIERMEKPYQKVRNFVSGNRGKMENVKKVLNKFVSNFQSFFSRFGAINGDDNEDDVSFDDLQIKDDDLAEMRRRILQRYEN